MPQRDGPGRLRFLKRQQQRPAILPVDARQTRQLGIETLKIHRQANRIPVFLPELPNYRNILSRFSHPDIHLCIIPVFRSSSLVPRYYADPDPRMAERLVLRAQQNRYIRAFDQAHPAGRIISCRGDKNS